MRGTTYETGTKEIRKEMEANIKEVSMSSLTVEQYLLVDCKQRNEKPKQVSTPEKRAYWREKQRKHRKGDPND